MDRFGDEVAVRNNKLIASSVGGALVRNEVLRASTDDAAIGEIMVSTVGIVCRFAVGLEDCVTSWNADGGSPPVVGLDRRWLCNVVCWWNGCDGSKNMST